MSVNNRSALQRRDRDMVDLETRWAPFGGPDPEEIFVRFGMSPERYRQRLQMIRKHTMQQASDESSPVRNAPQLLRHRTR